MKKGDSIHRFLAKVLDSIRKEFTELRYIKLFILKSLNYCLQNCCFVIVYRIVVLLLFTEQ